MNPLISVIVPARNEENDLPAALQAVAAQSVDLTDVEVIVVDGDSTDRTAAVATDILSSLDLHSFQVLPNPGGNTPSNLNRAVAAAQGTYVVRVDARSIIPNDYIARTTSILANRPSVSVVGGTQQAMARSDSTLDCAIAEALNNPMAMGGSRYRRGAASGPADTVYLGVFRRAQLVEVGGWDEHFSTNQDFELNRRMANLGEVWFEAGLPVEYLPRRTVTQLFQQYHRFGRWKAHYWRHTGRRPQQRQLVLLAFPPLAVGLGFVLLRRLRTARIAAISIPVAVGMAAPSALLSWAVNGVVALAWWSGVVRGLFRDDVT